MYDSYDDDDGDHDDCENADVRRVWDGKVKTLEELFPWSFRNYRAGRGRAAKTNDLIAEMAKIAKAIQPCSVRAIAYQLFNQKLIPSMDKANTQKVSDLSVKAREEGTIPWEWIADSTRQEEIVSTWADLAAYAGAVQQSYRKNKWKSQPKHVCVWSEKATIEGTLRGVVQEYDVPLKVLHGWSGATAVMDAVRGNQGRHQATLILYVGDYDPSGLFMSEVDLPKRLARYGSDDPSEKDLSKDEIQDLLDEAHIEIRRIALTKAHTQLLPQAPRFDVKDKKKDPRYNWFVKNHGEFCWELDAMNPNDLRDCVEKAILRELDQESWDRCFATQEAERSVIRETCASWR